MPIRASRRCGRPSSVELLTDDEKLLFTRLGVFRGGCNLEAAEQVRRATTLQSLVDKNLLRHSGERFWMLQTIREYARELLEQGGEREVVRRRHAEHYLGLAEAAHAARSDPYPTGRPPAARRGRTGLTRSTTTFAPRSRRRGRSEGLRTRTPGASRPAIDATWEDFGVVARPRVIERWRDRDLGAARFRLGDARAAAALEEGRAMTWEQAVVLAPGQQLDE